MTNNHLDTDESSATTLLDATIEAFDQGQTASPQEGLSLINDWFTTLKNDNRTSGLTATLSELQTQLEGTPSNATLRSILDNLATQTEKLAGSADGDYPSRLMTLSQALRNFSSQLSTAV